MPTPLKPAHFPWFDYSRYTFSLGLDLGGGTAILSGHTASEYDRDAGRIVVKGSLTDQVRTAYAKIEAILGAAGLSLSDVVRVVEYVKVDALGEYAEIASVRGELLGGAAPVVNTVCVDALLRPAAFLEIEVTAKSGGEDDPLSGIVYLPSIVAPGGDAAEQTANAYAEVERRLGAIGLSADAVTKVVEYVAGTPAQEVEDARLRALGDVRPAFTRVPVSRLLPPEALVQLDVMASTQSSVRHDLGWNWLAERRLSAIVSSGRLLFLSGQGGLDPRNGELTNEGDVAAQASAAFDFLEQALAAVGSGLGALVKTIEYTTPEALGAYRGVADVRSRLLQEPYPASTGLIVPRLEAEGQLIEVDSLALL